VLQGFCFKDVIPVLKRRSQSNNSRVESDHGAGQGVSSGVCIKAAVNMITFGDERREPRGIRSCASGGEAAKGGMECKAANGVDSRLTEDDGLQGMIRDGKEAVIFTGTRSQATPAMRGGATKLSANREVLVVPHQEYGVVSIVSVEGSRLDEWFDQPRSNAASCQVIFNLTEFGSHWSGELQ